MWFSSRLTLRTVSPLCWVSLQAPQIQLSTELHASACSRVLYGIWGRSVRLDKVVGRTSLYRGNGAAYPAAGWRVIDARGAQGFGRLALSLEW